MTTTFDVQAIFQDAHNMHTAAMSRMEQGDIRDAAEKAWCATLRATEALVLARTGEQPHTSTAAGRRLRAAAEADASLGDLRYRYLHRQVALHGECFYHDYCDPVETERLIQETDGFIRDAEQLAESAS